MVKPQSKIGEFQRDAAPPRVARKDFAANFNKMMERRPSARGAEGGSRGRSPSRSVIRLAKRREGQASA